MAMDMRVIGGLPASADVVAVGVFEGAQGLPRVIAAEPRLRRAMKRALQDFKRKSGSVMTVPLDSPLKRLMLVGLGKREGFELDQLRWAAGIAAKAAAAGQMKKMVLFLHGEIVEDAARVGQAIAEGLELATFAYREFKKGDAQSEARNVDVLEQNDGVRRKIGEGLRKGKVIGEAVNYAREIASKPANVIHPGTLVAEARRLAAREKLKITVIDAQRAKALGMGGLVAVGQGSEHPPAMIFLEYTGPGAAKKKPVVVVGKSITYDTGGYSIKPTASMVSMKYDKCGGMAVLGIMQAAARLKLPVHIVGVMPAAENSVSGHAYRPGDILRMYNGKTVEITNTDAEGRLVLEDALSYAAKKYEPSAMIDLATLTGGVVVALGSVYAGLFANDDALARGLEKAGQTSGEWLWRPPLHERYEGLMEGYQSDLVNSGIREASPIQGAIFLQNFVPRGVKWAHLDIAGTGDLERSDRYFVKGATGFGVRLVLEWLRESAN